MVKIKKKLYILYFIILLIIIAGYSWLYFQTKHASPIKYTQNSGDTNLETRELYFEMPFSKGWQETGNLHAYQFDATFYNTTPYEMSEWEVKFRIPEGSRINDSWGMDIEENEDRIITVRSVDYNEKILGSENITFGFIIFSQKDVAFDSFEISAVPHYKLNDFPMFYILFALSLLLFIAVVSTFIVVLMDKEYKKRRDHDKEIIVQSMKTFSNFIDAKDPYTKGHSARVAYYSRKIAEKMDFTADEIDNIYYIALLHDVGKIVISDDILMKPGKLTPEERKIIETHTVRGATILKDFTAIESIVEGAMYHHERYDGNGYPNGLSGDDIPLISRIICVADSYDAMNSDRCYRKALSKESIIQELENNCDKQFDESIVRILLDIIEDDAFEDMNNYVVSN